MSKKTARKYAELQKTSEVEKPLLDQFGTGKWQTLLFQCCRGFCGYKYYVRKIDILGGHH